MFKHPQNRATPWFLIGLLILISTMSGCLLFDRGQQDPKVLAHILHSEADTRRLFQRYTERLPKATINQETTAVRHDIEDLLAKFELASRGDDITAKQLRRLLRLFDRAVTTRTDQNYKPWSQTEADRFNEQLRLAFRETYLTEQTKP